MRNTWRDRRKPFGNTTLRHNRSVGFVADPKLNTIQDSLPFAFGDEKAKAAMRRAGSEIGDDDTPGNIVSIDGSGLINGYGAEGSLLLYAEPGRYMYSYGFPIQVEDLRKQYPRCKIYIKTSFCMPAGKDDGLVSTKVDKKTVNSGVKAMSEDKGMTSIVTEIKSERAISNFTLVFEAGDDEALSLN